MCPGTSSYPAEFLVFLWTVITLFVVVVQDIFIRSDELLRL